MERIWFTSDTHFGHKRIKEFCPATRYGKDIQEHDELLIRNWNSVIRPCDRVYHIGDFSWHRPEETSKIIRRLMGQKHLVLGNHDEGMSADVRSLFTSVSSYKEISLEGIRIILFHFPIHEWHRIHKGAFHFHGHTHGSVVLPGRALDVGIDGPLSQNCRMSPYSWEECKKYCIQRPIGFHHGKTTNL